MLAKQGKQHIVVKTQITGEQQVIRMMTGKNPTEIIFLF